MFERRDGQFVTTADFFQEGILRRMRRGSNFQQQLQTKTRITNARKSALSATPAAHLSGVFSLSLQTRNTRTAKNLQRIETSKTPDLGEASFSFFLSFIFC